MKKLYTLIAAFLFFSGSLMAQNLNADFEDLPLDPESYWNGSDGTGVFISGQAHFYNDYNAEFFSWSGWSYSSMSDISTPGFENQYSAITGAGYAIDGVPGGIYGVCCLYGPGVIDFPAKAHAVEGFYVTNATYTALSMQDGDMFAKKFGGEEGADPDFLRLLVWGRRDNTSTDTLEFYLADYRFDEVDKDYIIKTWEWVDLTSLGKVDSLAFGLESSDNSDWGMNTPAYFCLDNLQVIPDASTYVTNPVLDILLYPNPGTGLFRLDAQGIDRAGVKVYSLTGSLVYENMAFRPGEMLDLSDLPSGMYMLRISSEERAGSKLIQKY